MAMKGEVAYALAKAYVDETLNGSGALRGEDGFSPIITVNTNTDDEYKLSITTETGSFVTPNLKGTQGEAGEAYEPVIGTITTVDTTVEASASIDLDATNLIATFNFNIPKGEQGLDGEVYEPVIGAVTSVEDIADVNANVTLDSANMTATFDFALPKGDDGDTYTPKVGTVTVVADTADVNVTVDLDTTTKEATFNFAIPKGLDTAYVPIIGTVNTVENDVPANATVDIDAVNLIATYNFDIPKGVDGEAYTPVIGTVQSVASDAANVTVDVDVDNKTATYNFDVPRGFSPSISVFEDTETTYQLEITDENGTVVTPNLKASGTDLEERVTKLEDAVGDITTLEDTTVTNLVDALNKVAKSKLSTITYTDKILTLTYENGNTYELDLEPIIGDIAINELKDVTTDGITDGQILVFDGPNSKFVAQTPAYEETLQAAKDYTDEKIDGIAGAEAVAVDAKPSAGDAEEGTWYYYMVDGTVYQTIYIGGVEFTINAGDVDFTQFVMKDDVLTSYDGVSVLDPATVVGAGVLRQMHVKIVELLQQKVSVDNIADDLTTDDATFVLSAKQGKLLNESKIDKTSIVTVIDDTATDDQVPSAKAVFQSVSRGKELIASAVTDMGVDTSNTDTFQTMADNIRSISSGTGNALPEHVLAPYTFTNNNGEQTGTMTDYSSVTVDAVGSIGDIDYAYLTPETGYYDDTSKIRVPKETIERTEFIVGQSISGSDRGGIPVIIDITNFTKAKFTVTSGTMNYMRVWPYANGELKGYVATAAGTEINLSSYTGMYGVGPGSNSAAFTGILRFE